jgi:hypothetical protein
MKKLLLYLFVQLLLCQSGQSQELQRFYDSNSWKWGYKNEAGKVIIPATFNDAKAFHEGVALVYIRTEYSDQYIGQLINENGKLLYTFPDSILPVGNFSDSLMLVGDAHNSNVFGYLNHSFQLQIPFVLLGGGDFKEGIAAVELAAPFDSIKNPEPNGVPAYYITTNSAGLAVIDKKGKVIHAYGTKYAAVTDPGTAIIDGVFPAMDSATSKFGLIDLRGKPLTKFEFDKLGCFSEGKAYAAILPNSYMSVAVVDETGYIDKSGAWVIKLPEAMNILAGGCYYTGEPFHNGKAKMYIVEKDGDCSTSDVIEIHSNGEIVHLKER